MSWIKLTLVWIIYHEFGLTQSFLHKNAPHPYRLPRGSVLDVRRRTGRSNVGVATSNDKHTKVDEVLSSSQRQGHDTVPDDTVALIDAFLTHMQTSIVDECWEGFSLKGPTKPKNEAAAVRLRGSVRVITGRPIVLSAKQSSKRGSNTVAMDETMRRVVQVTFKYHGATDICKNWNMEDCVTNLKCILLAPVSEPAVNTISNEPSRSVPLSEWHDAPVVTRWGHALGIQSATLQTKGIEWNLAINRASKNPVTKLTQRKLPPRPQDDVDHQHDRKHMGPVNVTAPVWQALGVTTVTKTASGIRATPKTSMASKLRQCQKFVEIVHRLVTECQGTETMEASTGSRSSTVPWNGISVVDMGCGRGYLTFALHSYLYQTYQQTRNIAVTSRGIDVRPKLVNEISAIAASLGPEFENLQFETGTIESYLAESRVGLDDGSVDAKGSGGTNMLDVFIALHACDTATDDALWSALSRKADVIVVAPCCHQQVRPQVNAAASEQHPYADVLRHNIYRERLSETVTDSLRALLLELHGLYTVQVFEFIGGEHTSKNVMITAVKKKHQHTESGAPSSNSNDQQLYRGRLDRIRALSILHGIRTQKLAEWMGVSLVMSEHETPYSDLDARIEQGRMRPSESKRISARSMPPIQTKNL